MRFFETIIWDAFQLKKLSRGKTSGDARCNDLLFECSTGVTSFELLHYSVSDLSVSDLSVSKLATAESTC